MAGMQSKAKSVEQYLQELPDDRRDAIQAVRKVILKNLPKGYEEGMQYGMIGYYVPHSIYPDGYHCDPKQPLPFASLASQKNHMALYMFCLYTDPDQVAWFQKEWKKTGKKLDMGKSCLRFKKIENVALDVVGQAVKRLPVKTFIAFYESALGKSGRGAKPSKAKSAKPKSSSKSVKKAASTKKTPARKPKASPKKKSRLKSAAKRTAKKSAKSKAKRKA